MATIDLPTPPLLPPIKYIESDIITLQFQISSGSSLLSKPPYLALPCVFIPTSRASFGGAIHGFTAGCSAADFKSGLGTTGGIAVTLLRGSVEPLFSLF